jgi:hypothetical protein
MSDIFSQAQFKFPYRYKFPGQNTDEYILFVTRENSSMLWLRRAGVIITAGTLLIVGWVLGSLISRMGGVGPGAVFQVASTALAALTLVVGYWWVSILWRKSIAIVTTKRLTKFIYTTPVNRHNLSLPLDMIVDTGAYSKGFFQALLRLGTFTARSAAAGTGYATDDERDQHGRLRINKKYFYIENIHAAEDLQHYVSKVLEAHRHKYQDLPSFRPFIPKLKGESRKEYMKQFPEYWS